MTHGDERINVISNYQSGDIWEQGLTKREYFAAMALSGLLANPQLTNAHDQTIAMTCIDAADALIVALNRDIDDVLRSATAQTKAEVYDVMLDVTSNPES